MSNHSPSPSQTFFKGKFHSDFNLNFQIFLILDDTSVPVDLMTFMLCQAFSSSKCQMWLCLVELAVGALDAS
jgi:hypothetical protein